MYLTEMGRQLLQVRPDADADEWPLSCGQVVGINSACNPPSNFGLLGDLQRIFDLDSEIPHSALDFGVTK